jgi:hypothetical protein
MQWPAQTKDHARVAAIIEDAKLHKRFRRDRYQPDDEAKIQYMVISDEYLDLDAGCSTETALHGSTELTADDLATLTADGSPFSGNHSMNVQGMSNIEVSRWSDSLVDTGLTTAAPAAPKSKGKPPAPKAKGKSAAPLPSAGPPASIADLGGQGPAPMLAETPLQKAANLQKKLASRAGEAKKMLLQLQGLGTTVANPIISSLASAAEQLDKQYVGLNKFIAAGQNSEESYAPYANAGEQMLAYYERQSQYAKALQGVQRRQQQAAAAADVALAGIST